MRRSVAHLCGGIAISKLAVKCPWFRLCPGAPWWPDPLRFERENKSFKCTSPEAKPWPTPCRFPRYDPVAHGRWNYRSCRRRHRRLSVHQFTVFRPVVDVLSGGDAGRSVCGSQTVGVLAGCGHPLAGVSCVHRQRIPRYPPGWWLCRQFIPSLPASTCPVPLARRRNLAGSPPVSSCLAVLAIRPTMLETPTRPHCGGALVSQAAINKYSDEEA